MIVVFAAVFGLLIGLGIAVGLVVLVLAERPAAQVVVYRQPAPRVTHVIEATYEKVGGLRP